MDILIAVVLGIIAWGMMKGKPFHITIEHKYPEVKQDPGLEDPNKPNQTYEIDPFTQAIQNLNKVMTDPGGTDE